uniref:Uncharacterized protein n=1 Tax=Cyprinus carpio TaxID=7962 RepID=A0A8C1M8X7_CYPCA
VLLLPLSTVRCVVLTVNPTESRWTGTGVTVHTIRAVGAVFTWVTVTFINAGASEDVHIAACVARFTTAFVAANRVLTDGVISTRVFDTFIDIHLTCLAYN